MVIIVWLITFGSILLAIFYGYDADFTNKINKELKNEKTILIKEIDELKTKKDKRFFWRGNDIYVIEKCEAKKVLNNNEMMNYVSEGYAGN